MHQYHGVHSVLPAACGMPNYVGGVEMQGTIATMKHFSALSQILPHLDQAPLYGATNFSVGLHDVFAYGYDLPGLAANLTALGTGVGTFLCPSDGAGVTAGTNYRVNLGAVDHYSPFVDPNQGPISAYRFCSLAEVRDGLSATALIGEKLRGDPGRTRVDPRRDLAVIASATPTVDDYLADCRAQIGLRSFYNASGSSWLIGAMAQTGYNTVIEPNSTTVDCLSAGVVPADGLLGARSNHPGGVRLLLADGSCRFVTNGIDQRAWRALGTKAGGEVVTLDGP